MARFIPAPTGRSQFSGRAAGSLVHATMDFKGMRDLAVGISGDMKRADPAIRGAHEQLANELQDRQATSLEDSVSGYGRAQRHAVRDGALYKAITSPKNHKINLDGFTVGYLSDTSKFPEASVYAQGLDVGTDSHLTSVTGKTFRGLWIIPGGVQIPIEGAKNAIGMAARYGTEPGGFPIRNAITGYRFQEKGYDQWKAEGYGSQAALDTYEAYFYLFGLDFAGRLLSRSGKKPGTRAVRSRFVQGSSSRA